MIELHNKVVIEGDEQQQLGSEPDLARMAQ